METTLKQLLPPVIIIAVVIIFVAFFSSGTFKGQVDKFFGNTLDKAQDNVDKTNKENTQW